MDFGQPLTRADLIAIGQRFSEDTRLGPSNVLSIYLELEPDIRHERRRWLAMLNSGLRELQARHPGDRDLERLSEAAAQEVKELSPEHRGRSLAWFSGPPGRQWQRSLQMSTGTQFVWHNRPVLRPLVSVVDSAPTTGLMVVAQDRARLLTWRQGLLQEDQLLLADVDTSDWRRYSGAAVPAASQQSATHTEDFQARFAEQVDRFVRNLARQAASHWHQQQCELAVVVAAPKLSEVLVGALPAEWRDRTLMASNVNLMRAGLAELGEQTTSVIQAWNAARQQAMVQSVLSLAGSRGAAAIGPQDCLDLLVQHRVTHLYLSNTLELTGYPRQDGSYNLYPSPGTTATPEPHLVEWLISLCLASSAGTTIATGDAAELLRASGGMAAALRY